MKRLAWDDRAFDDLTSIEETAPGQRSGVIEYIRSAALTLETFPELILTRYPYILVYEIVGDEVRIAAIYHHSQDRR